MKYSTEVWSIRKNPMARSHIYYFDRSTTQMCFGKYNFWHETGYLFRSPLKWYIHRVRPAATWKIPPKTDQPDLDPLYTLARQGKRERALKLHAALNVNQSAVNPARESAVTEEIKLFFYLIWASAFVAPRRE